MWFSSLRRRTNLSSCLDELRQLVQFSAEAIDERHGISQPASALLAAVERILDALPENGSDDAPDRTRLQSARRYLQAGERGAARYELKQLLSQARWSEAPPTIPCASEP